MSHDQLFKDLLRGFFYDFLTLFLPEIAGGVDPASIEFLDVQDFTDRPEGDYRVADLVARLRYRDELPRLVIVHTEVESKPDGHFPYRLWEYNALLTLRHGPPVVSIGLLPFVVGRGVEFATYSETAFGREYRRLDYWRISLRGLPAESYLEGGPALGVALAALMRPPAGGKVELKAAIFARLRRGDLAPGTRSLFFNFVQTYLELDAAEHAEFARRMAPEGDVTMEALEQTWLDREIAKGFAERAPWVEREIAKGFAERAPWVEREIAKGFAERAPWVEREIAKGFAERAPWVEREIAKGFAERAPWVEREIAKGFAERAPWVEREIAKGFAERAPWVEREIAKGFAERAPWVEREIEKGIAEHAPWADRLVEQAALQGKRDAVLRQARARFGVESAELEERLANLDGPALDAMIDRVVVAPDLKALLAG